MRSTKRGQMTKMRAIFKTMWLVQVLTAFVLHTGAVTTEIMDSITTNSHVSPETRQDLMTTMATTAGTTTAPSSHADESTVWIQHLASTEQPSVRELDDNQGHSGLTSPAENDQTTSSIHKSMNPDEMTVSSSPTSLATDNGFPDTRTTPELTIQDELETTAFQKDHSVKTTPFLTWTEGGSELPESTSKTDDAKPTAFPLADTMNKSDEIPTSNGSYVTTEQASLASTTAMSVTTQTTPNNRTNVVTALAHEQNSTGQTEYNNWTLNSVYSTQIPNQRTEETTIPGNVHMTNTTTTDTTGQMGYNNSTPKTMYSTVNPNQSTENVHNTTNTTTTDTTGQMGYNNSTHKTVYSTLNPNQSTENVHKTTNTTTTYTTGQMGYNNSTPKTMYSTLNPNQSTENVHNTTNTTTTYTTGQMGYNNSTPKTMYSTLNPNQSTENVHNTTNTTTTDTTGQMGYNNSTPKTMYSTLNPNQSTENDHNTTNTTTTDTTGQMGYNNSTPKTMYSTLNPNQSTENDHNTTNTTKTHSTVQTESTYIWTTHSSITNTSKNISRSDAEWTLWPNCVDETQDVSSKSRRSSKLTCLITLWILGMIASIFLGLTIFLWVRLSVVRKTERGRKKRKDRDSLWAEPPTEENLEFYYANGATLEADKKRKKPPKVRRKKSGARQTGEEEDMWIQPKVTLEEITEFWSASGRARNDDRMDRRRDGL